LPHIADIDNPRRRLPWTLPTALLIWAVALWGAAYFMEKPIHRTVELSPIDVQVIGQSAAAGTQSVQPGRPAAVRRPGPKQPSVIPQVSPRAEQNPADQKAEVTTNTVAAVPAASTGGAHATPAEGQATAEGNTAANSGTPAGSNEGEGSPRGNIYESSGAWATVRPMPEIPDDLREELFNSVALARFNIAVDGSVKVELARPTPNPHLNRVLLDSLRKWRFIPAIKNGKPVASTEEIIVKIQVK